MSDLSDEMNFAGPSAQDVANGTAILASALVREAEALATTATGLRGAFELFDSGADAPVRAALRVDAQQAARLSGALVLCARLLLQHTGEAAHAARETAAALPRFGLSGHAVLGHLRAASLAPVTDDGAARIAAAIVAETFAMAFEAARRGAEGN